MKKRIKNKWLKALRSGEYRQGKDQLCELNGYTGEYEFCCLGVLENLYCLEHNLDFEPGQMLAGEHSIECAKWAGLDNEDTNIDRMKVRMKTSWSGYHVYDKVLAFEFLQTKNDEGWTFNRIANWIEKRL